MAASQLLPLFLLLLLGQPVLGLRDLELAVALEFDKADTEIGSSEIKGEILADLVTCGPLHGELFRILSRAAASTPITEYSRQRRRLGLQNVSSVCRLNPLRGVQVHGL